MLMAEADIRNDGSLRPGLFVRADIVTLQQDEGLSVPLASLITFAGLEKVVTVRDGKALEKTVGIGRRGPDWVEVVSGLKLGELVVVEPGNLRTGQPVSVAEPQQLQTSKTIESSGP
jgi:multidrug efflux pump subunit AcrA (membrane-fusion protein)